MNIIPCLGSLGLGDDIKKQGLFSSFMNPPTSDVMKSTSTPSARMQMSDSLPA